MICMYTTYIYLNEPAIINSARMVSETLFIFKGNCSHIPYMYVCMGTHVFEKINIHTYLNYKRVMYILKRLFSCTARPTPEQGVPHHFVIYF